MKKLSNIIGSSEIDLHIFNSISVIIVIFYDILLTTGVGSPSLASAVVVIQ